MKTRGAQEKPGRAGGIEAHISRLARAATPGLLFGQDGWGKLRGAENPCGAARSVRNAPYRPFIAALTACANRAAVYGF